MTPSKSNTISLLCAEASPRDTRQESAGLAQLTRPRGGASSPANARGNPTSVAGSMPRGVSSPPQAARREKEVESAGTVDSVR